MQACLAVARVRGLARQERCPLLLVREGRGSREGRVVRRKARFRDERRGHRDCGRHLPATRRSPRSIEAFAFRARHRDGAGLPLAERPHSGACPDPLSRPRSPPIDANAAECRRHSHESVQGVRKALENPKSRRPDWRSRQQSSLQNRIRSERTVRRSEIAQTGMKR